MPPASKRREDRGDPTHTTRTWVLSPKGSRKGLGHGRYGVRAREHRLSKNSAGRGHVSRTCLTARSPFRYER